MILNLVKGDTQAKAKVVGIVPKRSATNDGNLTATLTVSCRIEDEADAKILGQFAPGAVKLFRAGKEARRAIDAAKASDGAASGSSKATEGTWGKLTIKLPESSRNFRATMTTDDGEIELGPIEVKGALTYQSAPKESVVVYKFQIEETIGEEIGQIADMLDLLVDLSLERIQEVLPFPQKAEGPEKGQVASFIQDGIEYAGIVLDAHMTDDDGTNLVEIDDCGEFMQLRASSCVGALSVDGSFGETLDEVVERYVGMCSEAGTEASWKHLVIALGKRYHDTGAGAASVWIVDSNILKDAVLVAA